MHTSQYMPPPADKASAGLVAAGYVTGVLLPIVGFFVGLALIIKNRAGHGVAVMVLSVAVPVFAFAVAYNSSSGDDFQFTEPAAVTSAPTPSEAEVQKSWDAYYECLAVHNNRGEDYRTQLDACVRYSP
jgi:hypothetical protein